jgi:bla regulator protein BlaR1
VLSSLLRASLGGALGVAFVWTVCRCSRRLSASARAMLWWCVAAKFVIGLVWFAPVTLPILPAAVATGPAVGGPANLRLQWARIGLLDEEVALRALGAPLTMAAVEPPGSWTMFRRAYARIVAMNPGLALSELHAFEDRVLKWLASRVPSGPTRWVTGWHGWSVSLLAVWMIGVFLATGVGVQRWVRACGLVARSTPAPDETRVIAADLADRLSLHRTPDIRVSHEVETPFVVGVRRPVVLVPACFIGQLSRRQQQMALCHELAHIKRYDVPLGSAPALAEALFFFHPFARLAAREYVLSREAACDALVLDALDAPPREYGMLLLGMGSAGPQLGISAAGMSLGSSNLKRRLVMLGDTAVSRRTSRVVTGAAIVGMAFAMVPVRLVARPSTTVLSASTVVAQQAQPGAVRLAAQRVVAPRFDYILFRADGRVTAGMPIGGSARGPHPVVGVMLFGMPGGRSGPVADLVARARQFSRPGESLLWFRRGDTNMSCAIR